MIPATYPSILDSSNRTKMLVYQVPSITGLTRWVDYIPVKSPANESDLTLANTYANAGFILTSKVNDITGLVPFKDYVPIYLDSTATKAWSADNDGYIPMAELAGLLLDFTTGALDPRIAFTRATNATVTNSAGLITYAPHNLLTYSEQFDNAAWGKTNVTVTANTTISPNGTSTADKLVVNAATGQHVINQGTATANIAYTRSCYVKAGELSWVCLTDNAANAVFFNVSTGVQGTVLGTCTNIAIINIGNGWYRVSYTSTFNSVSYFGILATNADNTLSFTGDGTSGVYLWGAQLEIGSTATTYNSTTVKNLLGYSELFDNAAWTKSNSFVQTNLLTYSEDFSNAVWTKQNATVTANQAIAPNGYQTADSLIESNTTDFHRTYTLSSVTSGIVYTYSIYVKPNGRNFIQLALNVGFSVYANFDVVNGVVGTYTSNNATIQSVGNGWYRCTITGTATTTTALAEPNCVIVTSNTASNFQSYLGNGVSGLYIWGAQLVQGSVAGDYRRTDAAALPVYYANHNGVVCAEKLVENATTGLHTIYQTTTVSTGGIYKFSSYLKAAEETTVTLALSVSPFPRVKFNLSTGVIISEQGGATGEILSVGNGWYRCSILFTTPSTNGVMVIAIRDIENNFTGDGTSGIYIFGAQLSDSASLDPYVLNAGAAPTAAAYYGARFDYDPVTLAAKGLLIEEQRSNMLLNSAIAGTNLATQNVTVTAVAHTLSFYGTGNIVLSGTASATVTGTGAYPTRSTLTFTPTAGTLTLTVTGTVQFAQLEIGAFATSFIPTAASQVTRAADVATIQGSNFYSWYNQNEGTVYADYSKGNITASGRVFTISNNTNNNQIRFSVVERPDWQIVNGGSVEANVLGIDTSINAVVKIAGVYKNNDIQASVNGTLRTEDTTATIPAVSIMHLGTNESLAGALNGTIKSISYYPQRLSDSVLKGLTA